MEPASENEEGNTLNICELDYISRLPNSVIYHIYSLVTPRDVTCTSVLSKIWNRCWCTYPYVVFNFIYSSYCREMQNEVLVDLGLDLKKENFLNFMEKAVLRRLGQEFYMQRFQMYVEFCDLPLLAAYLNQWIRSVIGKGVPELALRVEIVSHGARCHYRVPQIVLLAESLKILSLSGCAFDKASEFNLPNLKKISLSRCEFSKEHSFHGIMSGCPVIEYIKISYCRWMDTVVSVSGLPELKHFEVIQCENIDNVEIHAPNLHTFSFASAPSQWPNSFDLANCTALKKLKLVGARLFGNFSLQDLITQLPSVEVLEFQHCKGSADFSISSQILKRLAFRHCDALKLGEIDTPTLLSFEYCYCDKPFIPIDASTNFKVHLILQLRHHSIDWLICLKNFLSGFADKDDLKLVVYQDSKTMIIHERLSFIPLSSLFNFMQPKCICISSKSFTELMDELLPVAYPQDVYVIYSRDKTLEVMSEKIKNARRNPNLHHKLVGFEVNTCEDKVDRMDPATRVLMEKHAIPPWKASVFTLKWKCGVPGQMVLP